MELLIVTNFVHKPHLRLSSSANREILKKKTAHKLMLILTLSFKL